MRSKRLQYIGCGLFAAWVVVFFSTVASAQIGDITGVHDPSIIQSGNIFYLFCTGRGLPERSSTDLFQWKRIGRTLTDTPDWTRNYSPTGPGWAPDISFINGEYRLYYAVSTFGKTTSAIGLSINKTLDSTSPDYRWVDHGKVIATAARSNWNAIDPCAFEDTDGNAWLVLGSCWSGLKLVQLDRKTGLLADASRQPLAVAANPPTNIIEEGYIRRHGDFYYLWESVDHCCRGVDSNYRILVGRSKDVRGPYIDRDGKPMLRGGGTLVLASYDQVRGPGSCAIIHFTNREFMIHHEYDGNNHGTPTLQIRQLFWASDDWPVVGEPIVRSPTEKTPVPRPFPGDWIIRVDYNPAQRITMHQDGTVGILGDWRLQESKLTITRQTDAKALVQQCVLSDDGTYFVGRDENGAVITGVRVVDQK